MCRNLRGKEGTKTFFFELWGVDLGCFQRGDDFWTQSFKGAFQHMKMEETHFKEKGSRNKGQW